MSVQTRYYRADSGRLPVAAKALHDQREACRLVIFRLLTELGASGFFASNHDGHINGIEFANRPDDTLWKPLRSGWWPKLNCTAGRALAARIDALPKVPPMTSALNSVGIQHHVPMLLGDGRCWFATLTGCEIHGIWFVGIPTLAKDGEPGQRFTPPAEWVEVKRWEAERDIEALVAARKRATEARLADADGGRS